ncbi:hypothetical protein CMI37_33365 [Candidatus Pacearchaeota archaeon]|jgi:hypothetical protein|nr:hypothetical protein [Candidatus Pacearchaeota archaeon]
MIFQEKMMRKYQRFGPYCLEKTKWHGYIFVYERKQGHHSQIQHEGMRSWGDGSMEHRWGDEPFYRR